MTLSIAPQTGGSPAPSEVVGRDDLIQKILAGCRAGTNFILSDPRRMGKTSLLIRLCNAPGSGVQAVKIDVQGASSVEDFVLRLLGGLSRHLAAGTKFQNVLTRYLDSAELKVGALKLTGMAKALPPTLALERALVGIDSELGEHETMIIALDEVTVALHAIAGHDAPGASQVLHTLRGLRERDRTRIRWVLTGSIGFHHVIRRANTTSGVLAQAEHLELGPLDTDGADTLTRALFRGIGRKPTEAAVAHLVERTNGIAFLLHNAVARLSDHPSNQVDELDAGEAYEAFATDRSKSRPMTHLLERIELYYPDAELTRGLLDTVAKKATTYQDLAGTASKPAGEDFRTMIDDLIDDHYLFASGNLLQWRYTALRDIWSSRRGLT